MLTNLTLFFLLALLAALAAAGLALHDAFAQAAETERRIEEAEAEERREAARRSA